MLQLPAGAVKNRLEWDKYTKKYFFWFIVWYDHQYISSEILKTCFCIIYQKLELYLLFRISIRNCNKEFFHRFDEVELFYDEKKIMFNFLKRHILNNNHWYNKLACLLWTNNRQSGLRHFYTILKLHVWIKRRIRWNLMIMKALKCHSTVLFFLLHYEG